MPSETLWEALGSFAGSGRGAGQAKGFKTSPRGFKRLLGRSSERGKAGASKINHHPHSFQRAFFFSQGRFVVLLGSVSFSYCPCLFCLFAFRLFRFGRLAKTGKCLSGTGAGLGLVFPKGRTYMLSSDNIVRACHPASQDRAHGAKKGGVVYCGIADIVERWIYTRQGVRRFTQHPAFPAPAFAINKGRTKVWRLADIEAFEKEHPEVLDEGAKERKQKGYARAILKGRSEKLPEADASHGSV